MDKNCTYDFGKKYKTKGIGKLLINNFYKNLKKIINDLDIHSSLEIGCGEGYSTEQIKKLLKKSTHLEASEYRDDLVKKTKSRNKEITIKQEDIYKLNRENSSFDMIFCLEVLEHLEEPQKAIKELHRVTSQYCIISVPNEPLWKLMNLCRLKYIKSLGNTPGHINHWNSKKLTKLLNPYFKILNTKNPTPWIILLLEKIK